MSWWIYVFVAFMVFSSGCSVALIGKPREPITHGQAIFTCLFNLVVTIWVLYAEGVRLRG